MATTLLHDMIHKEIEVYVDDMMVRSITREGHFAALDKFLARAEKYNLRLRSASLGSHLGNCWDTLSVRRE